MYKNLSYEKLKELPDEQKRNALMELKEMYPQYKDMAEIVGGTPAALANLYLRIVEGRKFGRKKKADAGQAVPISDSLAMITEEKQYNDIIIVPPKKAISFTICLDTEETGFEAKSRMEGILGSLLKDKIYRTHLSIEEV